MVFCAALNCLNYSKSKVSTFKFPANSKLRKQWPLKMKRKEFQPGKNYCICAAHFTEDYFRENLAIRRFSQRGCCAADYFFLFGKEITGKNVFRSTKTPLSVRL